GGPGAGHDDQGSGTSTFPPGRRGYGVAMEQPARPEIPRVRVLIADDQSMIRGGFEALLNAQDGITVVGTASDGEGIAEAVAELRPDVVLMDIRMPHVGGLEATRTVLEMPGTPPKIIMLTTFDADEYVFA